MKKCPKCGKKPCECEPELPVCPKCGKNPCECKSSSCVFAVAISEDSKLKGDERKNFKFGLYNDHGNA